MEKLEIKGLELEYSKELNNLKYEISNVYNHGEQPEKKMYRWVVLDPYKKYNVCANPLAKSMGSKTFEWHVETYYTANPRAKRRFNIHKTAHPVPGVHIAEIKQWWDGTVRDKDGYIVLACNGFKFGHVIMTSLWPWKVYDRWWMKDKNHIDIFTNR